MKVAGMAGISTNVPVLCRTLSINEMDRQECLSYERIRTKGDKRVKDQVKISDVITEPKHCGMQRVSVPGERPYEAGQRPFHVTKHGKGKPVMELFV